MNRASEEHRRFTRVPFPAVVLLRADGCQWECAVIDISLKGALLRCPAAWQAKNGQDVDLDVRIAEGVRIHMQGVVAHIESDQVGVTCQHIDLDSAAHLRRLVELNLGDEAQLHRELQALILPE
ncbi:MAG TPA: PilZ domain-containing protein [Acidiferrobacterales bacterium]|nr:PilZ domain-containing protein [Acidiferrobacterales bacterium]